jgi:hypothetical protein
MRCWRCAHIVIVPERLISDREPPRPSPQTYTEEVSCNCGAHYMITTTRLPDRVRRPGPQRTEEDIDRGKLWKGE